MPLCERLRINAGRPFIHSLIARLFVVVLMVTLIAGLHFFKKDSQQSQLKIATQDKPAKIYNTSWENNDKEVQLRNPDIF